MKKMDSVVMCKDGHTGALLTSILVAILMRKLGKETSLFFYKEALIAIVEKNFVLEPWWEKYLAKTVEVLKNHNLSADPMELLKAAVDAGVKLTACSLWVEILGEEKLPTDIKIESVSLEALTTLMGEAKQVITGL